MLMQCCVLFAAVFIVESATPCQTPSGQNGDCKLLTDCPILSDFFKYSLTRSTGNYLKKHNCGFSGKTPKVCCPTELTTLLADPTSCGYSTESKILGGEKTGLDEFPWMALLQYQKGKMKYFNCGGALISKRYVLTAAHCVSQELVGVRLGEHDTSKEIDCIESSLGNDCAPKPLDLSVEEAIVHESYKNDFNRYHDIALIRLNQDVEFSDYIKPICLPTLGPEVDKTYNEQRLFVAGWGITENDTVSSIKLKVKVPVRDKNFCESMYRRWNFNLTLSDNQFCAGGEKGKDACRGDSGGPLMTTRIDKDKANQWYVAGVVSFGPQPCGMVKWGGVYTSVAKYLGWISSNLRP